jgi:hypothetical protein
MHTHYVKEKVTVNGKTVEVDSDCIEFNDAGRITGWFLFSAYCLEWLPVDLNEVQNRWPGKFDDMKILCQNMAIEAYTGRGA